MLERKNYELMILVRKEFTNRELKIWALNKAKIFKQFKTSNISVISRGRRNLSYSINQELIGNYIQFNLSTFPKNIHTLLSTIKLDSSILRVFLLKKN